MADSTDGRERGITVSGKLTPLKGQRMNATQEQPAPAATSTDGVVRIVIAEDEAWWEAIYVNGELCPEYGPMITGQVVSLAANGRACTVEYVRVAGRLFEWPNRFEELTVIE